MVHFTRMELLMCIKALDDVELQKWVEDAGFGNVHFSTAYEIKKEVDGKGKDIPCVL